MKLVPMMTFCWLFAAISATAQNRAQTPATPPPRVRVTFYSSGDKVMTIPGSRAAFIGKLFDNDRELALINRRRFVTFRLAPGTHIFSSNWWPTTAPAGGAHLTIDLVAGHHYYISTSFEEGGFEGEHMIVQEVTCQDARLASAGMRPLEDKHVRPEANATEIEETSFPKCPRSKMAF